MSDNVLKYKEYIGSIEVSIEDECLYGKILHIEDLITYESDNPKGLQEAFSSAVDEYLELCAEKGKRPDVPFKGTFNIRIGEELHKNATIAAKAKGITLNEFIKVAVIESLKNKSIEAEPKSRPTLMIVKDAIRPRVHAEYRQAAAGGEFEVSYERGEAKWQFPQKAKSH